MLDRPKIETKRIPFGREKLFHADWISVVRLPNPAKPEQPLLESSTPLTLPESDSIDYHATLRCKRDSTSAPPEMFGLVSSPTSFQKRPRESKGSFSDSTL
jgi:hypothetical protein